MNPIATAIITALETGSPMSLPEYTALKSALGQKAGPDSPLMLALSGLEQKPLAAGWRQVFLDELEQAFPAPPESLLQLARKLHQQLTQPPPRPRPLQLPHRAQPFIPRPQPPDITPKELLPGQAVILVGPPGSGKSALLAEWAAQLVPASQPPERFPDGLLYYSFYRHPRVDFALEQIARAFGEPPQPSAYDAVRRLLETRRVLLILDDIDEADDLPGLLDVCRKAGVLAASNRSLPRLPHTHPLPPLSAEEGLVLLDQWAGWYARDRDAARQISQKLDHLPLSLRLAGQFMTAAGEDAPNFLAWLEQTQADRGQTPPLTLLLDRILARLDRPAREILSVCGLLAPAPFETGILARALTPKPTGTVFSLIRDMFRQTPPPPAPDTAPPLRQLVKFGLLAQVDSLYRVTHPVLHRFARERLLPTKTMVRQLATWFIGLAWDSSLSPEERTARLQVNLEHMMTVLGACLEWEEWEAAHGLAIVLEDFLDHEGYTASRIRANEIGLIASWQLGRPSTEAWLGNLGDTYREMGNPQWAIKHFEKALETARLTGNLQGQANALGNLGLAYRDMGQPHHARDYLQQALPIFERIDTPAAEMVRTILAELDSNS